MKIQLIGTGTIPDVANGASVLINDHILFDIPNGNLKAMIRQNIDIMNIDTLIISHTHADHCFDAPFSLWYKKNYYKPGLKESIKIVTDEITKNTIDTLIKLSYFSSAKEIEKEFIDSKDVNYTKICDDVEITNEPMEHSEIKFANGYIIKDKNVSIGLTGDTSYCEGVRKIASKVNYLICDMTLMLGNDSHMGIDNILEIMEDYPNLKIIPIHMHDKTRAEAKKLEKDNLLIYDDCKILEV